ncbi:FadR family transcriptional regulator [Actinomadura bangladeshensis]|uniref:FadR family transcriptional regulator n=2 Tax=Actinomadura bangladeshensis TaxID=453573 RepID=A0A4R4P753_9ACTN|nr:FadR family transcriptional regulator [Actinomadura bangladeshensis]
MDERRHVNSHSAAGEPLQAHQRRGSASAGGSHQMTPAVLRDRPETGRVAERVVRDIWSYIEGNGLTTGSKLPPERVFMELFGVGRSSLREALRVLSTLGVIDVRHGNGMYVAAPPPIQQASPAAIFDATEKNALRNLVETRLGIELAAVTAATARATDDDFAGLHAMLDDQQARLRIDPDFAWEPLGFELAVVEISGNTWLYEVELMLRDSWLALSTGLRASVGRHEEWLTEHRAIVASMRSRNLVQAQRLVMAHLNLERFEEDLASPSDAPDEQIQERHTPRGHPGHVTERHP